MVNSNPLVSIIVPCYNSSSYINEFIDCIKNQTYSNWELVFIDDGSTDNTKDLIKAEIKKDNRISLHLRDRLPKGSVTCRNIGQTAIQGEFFIHFDSDDIVANYCLEQRVKYMVDHSEIEYASFKGETAELQSNGEYLPNGQMWGIDPKEDLLACFLRVKYSFSVWNNIYRSSCFRSYLWDENVKIYTDFSYIVPAIIQGKKHSFASDSRVDYYYRIGQKNTMTSNFISDEKYLSTKYLFKKTLEMIQPLERSDYYEKCFSKFFIYQYEKILVRGTVEQASDFYDFCKKCVGKRLWGRIYLMKLLFANRKSSGIMNNDKKKVDIVRMALFDTRNLFVVLKKRIIKRK